jgi:hypothetical protein
MIGFGVGFFINWMMSMYFAYRKGSENVDD